MNDIPEGFEQWPKNITKNLTLSHGTSFKRIDWR